MSLFDLPEPQKFFDGGDHDQENIEIFTWGEDSYNSLGVALQERGDELNDETFGGSGPVGIHHYLLQSLSLTIDIGIIGKDFDFSQQTSSGFEKELGLSGLSRKSETLRDDSQGRIS